MYFFELLEIINKSKKELTGKEIEERYISKHGPCNHNNINRTLKILGEKNYVKSFKKTGPKVFYTKKD